MAPFVPISAFEAQFKFRPTVEEVKKVHDYLDYLHENPEETIAPVDKPQWERKRQVVIFYFDYWLAIVTGCERWTVDLRTKRAHTYPGHEVERGVFKAYISIPDEAFGIIMCENHCSSWMAKAEWKKANRNSGNRSMAKPNYSRTDPKTHCFKAKWSDHKGQPGAQGCWDKNGVTKVCIEMHKVCCLFMLASNSLCDSPFVLFVRSTTSLSRSSCR